MAGSSLLALIDDIATILDDVALMTKVAAKKTAGVLGDDLALNAQQVSGVSADRELPVVWAVAKGSFLNKLILVPAALTIGALLPWLIMPLLMLGGAFLCFEGFEKVVHSLFHSGDRESAHAEKLKALEDPALDLVAFEKEKIKGAIRTDFILSAEIIVIALGTVAEASLTNQIMVVSGIALLMTAGVYSLVAGIVKLDDLGLYLLQGPNRNWHQSLKQYIGAGLLWFAPRLMKSLTLIGTLAMFLVGGSILLHGLPDSHHAVEWVQHWLSTTLPGLGSLLSLLTPTFLNMLTGLIAGALILLFTHLIRNLFLRQAD
jgi:hypothetical protein